MRPFWPAGEAAQADYERLREAVLSGAPVLGVSAARFERRGLTGLISWPASEPVFSAVLSGAERARWSPHADLRVGALAAGYGLLVAASTASHIDLKEVHL